MTTAQTPIGSGYGARTTAATLMAGVDLTGRTVIVTGGYSGLGLETVRAFRGAGADVVVPARRAAHAREILAAGRGIDILVNNAAPAAASPSPGGDDRRRVDRRRGQRRPPVQEPRTGRATSVWAATDRRLDGAGGVYCEDCDIASPTDVGSATARVYGVDAHAVDPDAAARLWTLSAELVGVDAFAVPS